MDNRDDHGGVRVLREGRVTIVTTGNDRVRIDPATGDVYKNGALIAKGPRR